MNITLGEDDALLFGGVPRTVVVTVSLDDGDKLRFPYSANKSINSLYKAINNVLPTGKHISVVVPVSHELEPTPTEQIIPEKKSNSIEREDIVTCVKLEDRGEGASVDFHVGGEYRVLSVHAKTLSLGNGKKQHIIDGYDIIDDNAPVPMRFFVMAHEVVLARKGNVVRHKSKKEFEEILKCPKCEEQVSCVLRENKFCGHCDKCGDFSISRIIHLCKCGAENSLFLYNGKFQGTCSKCKIPIEVQYE